MVFLAGININCLSLTGLIPRRCLTLSELVAGERLDSIDDPARKHFLAGVLEELGELAARIDEMN